MRSAVPSPQEPKTACLRWIDTLADKRDPRPPANLGDGDLRRPAVAADKEYFPILTEENPVVALISKNKHGFDFWLND